MNFCYFFPQRFAALMLCYFRGVLNFKIVIFPCICLIFTYSIDSRYSPKYDTHKNLLSCCGCCLSGIGKVLFNDWRSWCITMLFFSMSFFTLSYNVLTIFTLSFLYITMFQQYIYDIVKVQRINYNILTLDPFQCYNLTLQCYSIGSITLS